MRVPFWPVAASLGGSSAIVFGREVYGSDAGPLLKACHHLFRKIEIAYLAIQHRVNRKHQYHVVRTGLYPGYHDPDNVMLYACMECLKRYVVDESGGVEDLDKFSADLREKRDPNGPQTEWRQADMQSEATAIYKWWTIERQANEARRDELMTHLYGHGRMTFERVPDSNLSAIKFAPFNEDELILKDEFRALEKKIDDDEQAMLHRLVDIRRSLWT